MSDSNSGTLQTATTIQKNTETLVGAIIGCKAYNSITYFIDYVKGDETTLLLRPYFMQTRDGTAYQDQDWTSASGSSKTVNENVYTLTISGNVLLEMSVEGFNFVKLTATADNTGIPTGTLAVAYTLKNTS